MIKMKLVHIYVYTYICIYEHHNDVLAARPTLDLMLYSLHTHAWNMVTMETMLTLNGV